MIRIGRLKMRAERKPPHIQVTIPAWDHKMVVSIPFWSLPKTLRNTVHQHFANTTNEPYRCHARVNLDAEIWEELIFDKWEIADEQD